MDIDQYNEVFERFNIMRCLGASTYQQGKFIVGRCPHQSSIMSFLNSALGYFGFGIYFIIERIEAEMPARGILGT